MSFVKRFIMAGFIALTASQALAQAAANPTGTYRIYLYFGDTKPFVDDIILKIGARGIEGTMHVPNDFDAPLERPVLTSDGKLSFHVTLPHKYDAAFPKGLDYILQFESPRASGTPLRFSRLIGFVEQKTNQSYVASVVGFRQE